MKYFFETYGCQMNSAESAALALAAQERGWQEAQNSEEAELVLLNTCSVRETAERRVRGRLAHYAAQKKKKAGNFVLVMAGCMAQRLGEKLKTDFPAVDYVMGTSARSRFPLILEAAEKDQGGAPRPLLETDEKPEFSFSPLHLEPAEGRSFQSLIPIMHGCNNYCSFCIVPYVRGREVSRSPDAILQEIRLVGERGVREITLLGQNVNSYLWEDSNGRLEFPGLLRLVASNIGSQDGALGVRWARFLSSHPKDFSDQTIQALAENPAFCRRIHLCVQHGSNRILSAMNRRYTREQYLQLIAKLRAALPGLSLSTDILVGFPGETEKDLEETLSLMEEVKFLYSYMYHFNPREGTAAYSLPGRIGEDVKRDRLARVIALQKRHTAELLKRRVGEQVMVLIEGISRKNADELICRTERDEMVVVPGSAGAIGSFATLTLSSLRGNTFRAAAFERLP
ncbi:MAG: tRNA (N6-isopentenyl adenosine(37)-C2)-methylthiotransferase MiaB [Treponema sp.]|nr:tRNA (N6-isopentenyl adenosine(37)-C2)-methylthiotransferase MiaB [Treponema sp.]